MSEKQIVCRISSDYFYKIQAIKKREKKRYKDLLFEAIEMLKSENKIVNKK